MEKGTRPKLTAQKFTEQVVFLLSKDDWQLLENMAKEADQSPHAFARSILIEKLDRRRQIAPISIQDTTLREVVFLRYLFGNAMHHLANGSFNNKIWEETLRKAKEEGDTVLAEFREKNR